MEVLQYLDSLRLTLADSSDTLQGVVRTEQVADQEQSAETAMDSNGNGGGQRPTRPPRHPGYVASAGSQVAVVVVAPIQRRGAGGDERRRR